MPLSVTERVRVREREIKNQLYVCLYGPWYYIEEKNVDTYTYSKQQMGRDADK